MADFQDPTQKIYLKIISLIKNNKKLEKLEQKIRNLFEEFQVQIIFNIGTTISKHS